MGKLFDEITPDIRAWVAQQHMFFVATAPLSEQGHVNCSPKGLDSLRILGPREVAYLDLTGSGAETIAHVLENGRVVLMFCAFDGPPKIVRFHGHGDVITPDTPEWSGLRALFPAYPAARAIIRVAVDRISDSCGYGVPKLEFAQDRDAIQQWAQAKGEQGVPAYQRDRNSSSIDGLPALRFDRTTDHSQPAMPAVQQLVFSLAPAAPGDLDALVAIRIEAMRESLERVGRFDPVRARKRFASSFSPEHTRHVVTDGERVGFVVVKSHAGELLLDHLYIRPGSQRRGIGAAVLALVFAEADAMALPVRVGALRESASNRFYLRHGFRLVDRGEFDNHYVRPFAVADEEALSIEGVSHITFIVRDLERMAMFICEGLGGSEVYDSNGRNFSLPREKFFVVGGTWIAAMEGEAPPQRTYRHLAFKVSAGTLPQFERRLRALGVDVEPPRPRVDGEGESLYFHDFDNHLFELHTGTLEQRLRRYAE